MKKNALLLLCATALSAGVVAAAVGFANDNVDRLHQGYAAESTYHLILNADSLSDASGSGTKTITSDGGATISFDYSGLTISDGNLVFDAGGTILNPRLSDGLRNRVTQIKQIVTTGEADYAFTVDYTWGDSLDGVSPYYQRRGYVVNKSYPTYSFLDERPNYLKFTATAASTVSSIEILYACPGEFADEGTDNLVISSATRLEQFKTVVNRGNGFDGQTVELGSNIDLSLLDKNLDGTIGNKDSTPFRGTFDGKDHVISNYSRSSSDTVALFSRVTGGTIKNLSLASISVECSGQRAAGVVARAENATLNNVHVLSGTITGSKQNGGLIGVSLGTTTISGCSNHASVTATSEASADYGTGGIVGMLYSGSLSIQNTENAGTVETKNTGTSGVLGAVRAGTAVLSSVTNSGPVHSTQEGVGGLIGYSYVAAKIAITITISNCENKGSVKGDALNGVGGIYGSNPDAASYLTLTIDSCVNRGSIAGNAHVGGIAGLPRVMKAGSHIDDCENYGDIKATAANGYVGGIVSRARIAVSNCRCYSEAKLTVNSTEILARNANADGKGSATQGGFILSVVDGTGSLTGTNKLINDDGTDYVAA